MRRAAPAVRAARDAVRVEDRAEPLPRGTAVEDAADHDGLGFVDAPLDMEPPPLDVDVVVAEHAPAGDVPGPSLPEHGVVGALARLFALEFIGERGQRQHDLVGVGLSSVRSRSSR
jgi:hypothetical protein